MRSVMICLISFIVISVFFFHCLNGVPAGYSAERIDLKKCKQESIVLENFKKEIKTENNFVGFETLKYIQLEKIDLETISCKQEGSLGVFRAVYSGLDIEYSLCIMIEVMIFVQAEDKKTDLISIRMVKGWRCPDFDPRWTIIQK